jgi:hypothetical protein
VILYVASNLTQKHLRRENSAVEFIEDVVEERFVGQVATDASGFLACLCFVSRLRRWGHAGIG